MKNKTAGAYPLEYRIKILSICIISIALSFSGNSILASGGQENNMKRITPILSVEDIESCLDFWVKKLGFQVTAEVKEGDKLGFVILMSDTKELMLQSLSSIKNDIPALEMELRKSPSVLYIEVADIEDIEKKLEGYEIIVPKRKTFYGATEIFYRSPGGHFIGFAQMGDKSSGQ